MTVSLFMTEGQGTPAPWSPPKQFVVQGPYAFVRNPMILSVLSILIGEALFFGSIAILIWCFVFWMVNTVYFFYFEEPGLVKRFGREYEEYRKHVHRWIPRLRPWTPLSK
jgi:protein-S-isoprenylcysteine O-methyltransferase Ste14